MQFGPLDIPDEVIAAQEAGELVVFVGSGVSCGGLSGLPNFEGLTAEIGQIISKTRDPSRKDYDVILGEWNEAKDCKVHHAAHRILTRSDSRPNDAHRLLLKLFSTPDQVKVVTTNYDRHLSTAATDHGLPLTHYRAPALPLGEDFQGIVYLHGSVDDKPERFVLTDADFGRAYLSQGWARIFLQGLYSKFTVLFVGFSHEDTLLTYLARGLPRTGPGKFAIQSDDNDEKKFQRWRQLGVKVIPYKKLPEPSIHNNLTIGLREWVNYSSLLPEDSRTRVWEIIDSVEAPKVVVGSEQGPSDIQLGRDREDFLKKILRDPNRIRWFAERAQSLKWIRWLHTAGIVDTIANDEPPKGSPYKSQVKGALIHWAIGRLVRAKEREAFELFILLGGELGPTAWRSAVQSLIDPHNKEAWESPSIDLWLTAIRFSRNKGSERFYTGQVVKQLAVRGRKELAAAFFESMLEVSVAWKSPWGSEEADHQPQAKITTEQYELQEAWEALKAARSLESGDRLLRILSSTVEAIYAASPTPEPRNSIDPLTGIRIEVDSTRMPIGYLQPEEYVLEMLLDAIRIRSVAPGGIGETQILSWLTNSRPGFQRIGYFALREDQSLAPARKVDLIIENNLICRQQWQLQHDPSSLAAKVFHDAAQGDKERLLGAVVRGPHTPTGSVKERDEDSDAIEKRFRDQFLYRMAAQNADDAILLKKFSELGLDPPSKSTKQGEVTGEPEFGVVRDVERSPQSAEELLKKTPEEQLDYFLTYKGQGGHWSGPNREGLLGAIVAAADANEQWARALISALITRGVTAGDLWQRLAWGMKWHTREKSFRIWYLLEVLPKIQTAEWTLADWNGWTHNILLVGGNEAFESLGVEEWEALLEWSMKAWDAVLKFDKPPQEKSDDRDMLNHAINHPVGRLVEFWIRHLDFKRRADATNPYSWSEPIASRLQAAVDRDGSHRLMMMAVFGQFLSFLRYAVPDWTKLTLYPRLQIAAYDRQARAIWSAWLCYGRLSADLAKELPEHFAANAGALLTCEKEIPGRFLSYAAAILASAFIPGNALAWVESLLSSSTPRQRALWNREIARCIKDAPPEQQKAVWDTWASGYFQKSRLGAWGALTPEEYSEFLRWPVAFAAIAETVFIAIREPAVQKIARFDLLHEVKVSGIAAKQPNFVAKYLRWLFESITTEHGGTYGMDDVIVAIDVTNENVADLKVLAGRLLVIDQPLGDQLLSKIKKWQEFGGTGSSNAPSGS